MYTLAMLVCFGGSVRDLGHDDFHTRQAAQVRLDRWRYWCWPLLGRRFSDPERARRAARVLRRAVGVNAPPPWLWHRPTCRYWYSQDVPPMVGFDDHEGGPPSWRSLLVYGLPGRGVYYRLGGLRARTGCVCGGMLRLGAPRAWADALVAALEARGRRYGVGGRGGD